MFPLAGGKAVDSRKNSETSESHVLALTRNLVAGDEEAFRQFHQQYFDRLYRFLLVLCQGQEQETRDALQQTLLRVIRYIRPFESDEVFWCWLKAVARSTARDIGRKQRRYRALLEAFALRFVQPSAQDHFAETDSLSLALQESLAELPAPERRLLEAKYLEGCTVKELGLQTGLTLKAVESRLDRLRRALRSSILRKISRHER